MATTSLPVPTSKVASTINILQLIASLLPLAESIIHSYVKSDTTKAKVSMVTNTASQLIPVAVGVISATTQNK
jgi:thiamine phosphate synthase YjbQ (UPF0047 family)